MRWRYGDTDRFCRNLLWRIPAETLRDPEPGRDFKGSRVIEQYHLSEKALYIPDRGFSWRYIPLDRIRGVIPGRESRDEESAMGGYHIELPTIRVIYGSGAEVLTVENKRAADELFALLRRKY